MSSFIPTKHFSEEEFLYSYEARKYGIDNSWESDAHAKNASKLLAEFLEPIRALVSEPIRISSGYRCPELNKLVKGSSTSAHMFGLAVDFEPLREVAGWKQGYIELIRGLVLHKKIPLFDQLIDEGGELGWIHLGIKENLAECRGDILKQQKDGSLIKIDTLFIQDLPKPTEPPVTYDRMIAEINQLKNRVSKLEEQK